MAKRSCVIYIIPSTYSFTWVPATGNQSPWAVQRCHRQHHIAFCRDDDGGKYGKSQLELYKI